MSKLSTLIESKGVDLARLSYTCCVSISSRNCYNFSIIFWYYDTDLDLGWGW